MSWAAERGHKAVVKLLVDKGAGGDTQDKDSRTPLAYAAESGYKAVNKLLLAIRKVEFDVKDKYGKTLLWYAAERGHGPSSSCC